MIYLESGREEKLDPRTVRRMMRIYTTLYCYQWKGANTKRDFAPKPFTLQQRWLAEPSGYATKLKKHTHTHTSSHWSTLLAVWSLPTGPSAVQLYLPSTATRAKKLANVRIFFFYFHNETLTESCDGSKNNNQQNGSTAWTRFLCGGDAPFWSRVFSLRESRVFEMRISRYSLFFGSKRTQKTRRFSGPPTCTPHTSQTSEEINNLAFFFKYPLRDTMLWECGKKELVWSPLRLFLHRTLRFARPRGSKNRK